MVLEDGKAALDALAAPDPSVSAAFYWVCSQYHKEKQV
jgi:26S proteasome regulatory subunit N9